MALKLDPECIEAISTRGLALVLAGRPDDGFVGLDLAVEKKPDSERTYRYRGVAYREMGLFQESLADPEHGTQLGARILLSVH